MTTYGRNPILIENIKLLRKSFWVSKQNYDYTIDAIVVLPNHIHMILTLDNAKNLDMILEYMLNNPVKHGLVENQDDWKYSSFYKCSHP